MWDRRDPIVTVWSRGFVHNAYNMNLIYFEGYASMITRETTHCITNCCVCDIESRSDK